MADANIRAVITAKDEASNVLGNFAKNTEGSFLRLGTVVGAVSGIVQSVTTKAISALSDSLGTAVKRVDTLDNATRTFENMGFKVEDTTKAMTALKTSILGLPTPLDAAVRNMELIASSTNDIGKAQKIFTALNDGIIGFGGSADMVNTAVIQLSQAFAGGRIMAQDWNSMLNAGLGPALNAIARQMHMSVRDLKEGLSEGSVSVEKFQDALIKLDEQGGGGLKSLQKIAKDSTKGIGTGIENMKTAIARGMANILKSIGTENISKAISSIGSAFENNTGVIIRFIGKIREVIPEIIKLGRSIGEYLQPKFEALWHTIETKVFPVFQRLWNEAIKPLLPVFGVIFVAAIGLTIDALNLLLNIITPIANFMLDHKQVVLDFAAAFGTLFAAIKIWDAIDKMRVGFEVLTNVTIPNIQASLSNFISFATGGGGFILVAAAAVAAAVAIEQAWYSAQQQIDKTTQATDSLKRSNDDAVKSIQNAIDTGKISADKGQKAISDLKHDVQGLHNDSAWQQFVNIWGSGDLTKVIPKIFGRAVGGPITGGTPYIVGERGPEIIVPSNSGTVVPNNKIAAGNSMGTVNITFNGVFTANEQEMRKLAVKVFNSYSDAKGMGTT